MIEFIFIILFLSFSYGIKSFIHNHSAILKRIRASDHLNVIRFKTFFVSLVRLESARKSEEEYIKMDDKKIYKILQHWFPLLRNAEVPKKKDRQSFETFLQWMDAAVFGNQCYLMKMKPDHFFDNELEKSTIFQDERVDIECLKQKIIAKAQPILEHYEQHKNVIGRYYNVHDQVLDIVLEEILDLAQQYKFELLLIYAEDYYWLLVPDDEAKIEKFCKAFSKQFKHQEIKIEHYEKYQCSRST